MNILLIGSGGREHAIALKLAESPRCRTLYVAPGNAGTAAFARNVDLRIDDFEAIGSFVLRNSVRLVVVGPEAPLVGGITDFFAANSQYRDVLVLGPCRDAARLEGSKDFAKAFMARHSIPTAEYRTFTRETLSEGQDYLATLSAPYVLKADGLAAGKGVLILDDLADAQRALVEMLQDAKFGEASSRVVIEQYLQGIELSCFVLTDGTHYKILPAAKDYKRVGDGDTGLNTGGMGAVSPVPFADREFMNKVEQRIVLPTLRGLRAEKMRYCGFLFVGLMNCGGDPYVVEYNVRMGDPETEVVFPRIAEDVVELFDATCRGRLTNRQLQVDPRTAACVMAVADGYPGSYAKGAVISGLDTPLEHSLVIHAGTATDSAGHIVTAGGRVLCVTSLASTLPEALLKSYQALDGIQWDGMRYRHDIGQDLLAYQISQQ